MDEPILTFKFINPNTDEETVAFLEKFLPEVIFKNQFCNENELPKIV